MLGTRFWSLGTGDKTDLKLPPAKDVLTNIQAIVAGSNHACALTKTGGVDCRGTTTRRAWCRVRHRTANDGIVLSGVQAIPGIEHTCALTTSGGVRCWGSAQYGQLGDDTLTSQGLAPATDV